MGFFSGIFGKSNKQDASAIGLLNTDIHSHLLWGLDDGSKSPEDSLELVRGLMELGYTKAITTPHIMSDFYQNTPGIINAALERLRNLLKENNIDFKVDAAAEYYLDFDFENKIGQGNLLTFSDNYLLFEVSYLNAPDSLDSIIFKLQTSGYKPVLAHPERYPFWYNNFSQYESLVDKGVLLQLNLNSLTGHYSPATKKIAEKLIDANLISLVGTDCHHTGHIKLLQKAFQSNHLHKLLNSGRILNNTL